MPTNQVQNTSLDEALALSREITQFERHTRGVMGVGGNPTRIVVFSQDTEPNTLGIEIRDEDDFETLAEYTACAEVRDEAPVYFKIGDAYRAAQEKLVEPVGRR